MTDDEVRAAALSDPDAQPLGTEELANSSLSALCAVGSSAAVPPDAPECSLLRAIERDPETMRRLLAGAA